MKLAFNIFILILFFFLSIISFLDVINVLDILSVLLPDPEAKIFFILELLFTILNIIGFELSLERLITFRDMSKDLTKLNSQVLKNIDQTNAIKSSIENIENHYVPISFIENRDLSYRDFFSEIETAPNDSLVCVTHFEKYRSIAYNSGETLYEKRLMDLWDSKIKNCEIQVRQIVHIATKTDMIEVEKRVDAYKNYQNFQLNVIIGAPVLPYLDMLVIRNHWGSIALSSDSNEPFIENYAISIKNMEIINELERSFNILWTKCSIPIKNKQGIDEKSLNFIKNLIPDDSRFNYLLNDSNIHTLLIAKYPLLDRLLSFLPQHLSKSQELSIGNLFTDRIENIINSVENNLNDLFEEELILDKAESMECLKNIFINSNSTINAVSWSEDQAEFWENPYGKLILKLNKDAVENRNVKITRIFILTQDQRKNDKVKRIIKNQEDIGISVLIASEELLPKELINDFLILDNELLFHLKLNNETTFIDQCGLSVNTKSVREMMQSFNQLRMRARKPGMNIL